MLVRKLYNQQLDSFYSLINLPKNNLTAATAVFDQFVDHRLTPELWQQQIGSEGRKNHLIMQTESSAVTVVRFTGELDPSAEHELNVLSNTSVGVTFVDQVQSTSDLLGKYRVQVTTWVVLAYLIVLFALLLRYRLQVWRIVMPPLLASVFTLAILVQLEQGINLFHLMALILVLGIGLDMGIFLTETNEAPHTWLAVSLSAATSLLAFGLLAMSDTPVLHHFGLTVAIGLSMVWLFAPLMRQN